MSMGKITASLHERRHFKEKLFRTGVLCSGEVSSRTCRGVLRTKFEANVVQEVNLRAELYET